MIMKEYILACKDALEAKLLRLLEDRQHFVENSDYYSIQVTNRKQLSDAKLDVIHLLLLQQDLINIYNKDIMSYLDPIYTQFLLHITQDCVVAVIMLFKS